MILHFPLDYHTEDNRVLNNSGQSNAGTLKGNPLLMPDEKFGACMCFDGKADYLEVASTADLQITGDLTLSAWVYIEKGQDDWVRIVGKGNTNDRNYGLWYNTNENTWLFQQYGEGNANLGVSIVMPQGIQTGRWYHVAATRSGNKHILLLDGKVVGSQKADITPLTSDDPLTIAYATYHSYHHGKIAQVRVYDRGLSEEEIRTINREDQTAMATFHDTHPINFDFQNDQQQAALFIDEVSSGQRMTLQLKNTSRQHLQLAAVVSQDASEDLHHFALRFRPGTLLEESLSKIKLANSDGWSMKLVKQGGGDVLIYLLATHHPKIEARKSHSIQLTGLRPDGQKGSRGTRLELFYDNMAYEGSATQIKGERITHLNIVNHSGKKNLPLHAGFHGSNKVLNDAVNDNSGTANKVVFHLTNALPYDPGQPLQSNLSFRGKDAEAPTRFFLSFDAQHPDETTKDWALGTVSQVSNVQIKVSVVNITVGNGVRKVSAPVVQVQDAKPGAALTLLKDVTLESGAFIEFEVSNIKSSLPSGPANLYLHYENVPGYWDGQLVSTVEKSPLVYAPSTTGFDRVGIGTSAPQARLEVNGIGGTTVDLRVSGRLQSLSNDGGLWIGERGDRFIGGHSNDKLGFYVGTGWQLNVLQNGNVGVGTTDPKARLEVQGSGGTNIDFLVNGRMKSNSNDGGLWVNNNRFFGGHSTDKVGIWTGNGWQLNVLQNGNVGIGTTDPKERLEVAGTAKLSGNQGKLKITNPSFGWSLLDVRAEKSYAAAFENNSPWDEGGGSYSTLLLNNKGGGWAILVTKGAVSKPNGSAWDNPSDLRLKKEVENYAEGLEAVKKIRPVWFRYNGKENLPDHRQVGIIAQELQTVAPHMVNAFGGQDGETYLQTNVGAMTFMLVNAVKELSEQVEAQRAQITRLEGNDRTTKN